MTRKRSSYVQQDLDSYSLILEELNLCVGSGYRALDSDQRRAVLRSGLDSCSIERTLHVRALLYEVEGNRHCFQLQDLKVSFDQVAQPYSDLYSFVWIPTVLPRHLQVWVASYVLL